MCICKSQKCIWKILLSSSKTTQKSLKQTKWTFKSLLLDTVFYFKIKEVREFQNSVCFQGGKNANNYTTKTDYRFSATKTYLVSVL